MGILKLKRGTEANRTSYTPAEGEIILTTDTNIIYVGDGSTAGGNAVGSGGGSIVGGVAAVGFSSIPTGYLECNGSTISRTTYADLFSAIGTTFGNGNGSTTFGIPDLRGEFIRGYDNGRGADSGRALGTYQQDEFQGHYHDDNTWAPVVQSTASGATVGFDSSNEMRTVNLQIQNPITGTNGSPRYGNETRPRNIAMMYLIKY